MAEKVPAPASQAVAVAAPKAEIEVPKSIPTPELDERSHTRLVVRWPKFTKLPVKLEYSEYGRLYYSWQTAVEATSKNKFIIMDLKPNTTYVTRVSVLNTSKKAWMTSSTSMYMTTMTEEDADKRQNTLATQAVRWAHHEIFKGQGGVNLHRDIDALQKMAADNTQQMQQRVKDLERIKENEAKLSIQTAQLREAEAKVSEQKKLLDALVSQRKASTKVHAHSTFSSAAEMKASQATIDEQTKKIEQLRKKLEAKTTELNAKETDAKNMFKDCQLMMQNYKDRMMAKEMHADETKRVLLMQVQALKDENERMKQQLREFQAQAKQRSAESQETLTTVRLLQQENMRLQQEVDDLRRGQ